MISRRTLLKTSAAAAALPLLPASRLDRAKLARRRRSLAAHLPHAHSIERRGEPLPSRDLVRQR